MLTLYRFQPLWGLSDISQFVMKVETYLRMTEIPYNIENYPIFALDKTPKGKLPFIEEDGKRVADSGFIVEYIVEKHGDKLDGGLDTRQRAISHAMRRMIEENLNWLIVQTRWRIDDNWKTFMDQLFEGFEDQKLLDVALPQVREAVLSEFWGHGIGRHSEEEVWHLGRNDISALSDFLGDNPYFMGDAPTSLDASAFSFLLHLRVPFSSPIKEHIESLENLVGFCNRMLERYYPAMKPAW